MADQQFVVFHPEPKVFQNVVPQSKVIGTPTVYQCDHVEYPEKGGILVFYKGLKLPVKGFPYPEAIKAINVVKKAFIRSVGAMASKQSRLLLFLFIFLPGKKKTIDKFIFEFNEFSLEILKPHVLQYSYLTEIAKEFKKFLTYFLALLGIEEAERFATVFSTLIEYDNAYRFRIEDILSETTQQLLWFNPSQEIARLLKIYCEREFYEPLQAKFKSLVFLIGLAFLVPGVKKAFRKALRASHFPNFQYDTIDHFTILNRGDYNFCGLTRDQRLLEYWRIQENEIPQQWTLHD